jgi:hypothetical protein
VGVPLYRIYPRKTEWVRERKREDKREEGLHRLQKRDSVDDLIDQVGMYTQGELWRSTEQIVFVISHLKQCCGIRDILVWIRMRIREAQKHTDPDLDPDPEHWYIYIILLRKKSH